MRAKVNHSTPMLHVASIERSIEFYGLLGFRLIDSMGRPMGWARLHCQSGDVMFLRAEHVIDAHAQGFMFYMYTTDLAGVHAHLAANQVAVSQVKHPEYMPSGTINLTDPDGYHIEIAQWGDAEQSAWEARLARKNGGASVAKS